MSELFLNLYVGIGLFISLTTWYFGNENIVKLISPILSENISTFIHHFVFFTLIFGFLLPKHLLKYHVLAICIAFLHWQTNDQKCILTEIHKNIIKNDNYTFVKNTIFQNKISSGNAFYFFYFLVFFSLLTSLYRLN